MKIIISTLFAVMLISGAAVAQHAAIGVKAGVNSSTISGNANFDSKIGFHLGLLGHLHLSGQFALQPELVYSVQGAKYDVAGQKTLT